MLFQRLVRKAEYKAEELKARTQDSFSQYMDLNSTLRSVRSTPDLGKFNLHVDSSHMQMNSWQDQYKAVITDLKAMKAAAVAFCDFAQARGQTRAVRFDRRMEYESQLIEGFRAHTPHGSFPLPDPMLSPVSPVSLWRMGERVSSPTPAHPTLRKKVSMRLATFGKGFRSNDAEQAYSPWHAPSNTLSLINSPQERLVASPEPTCHQRFVSSPEPIRPQLQKKSSSRFRPAGQYLGDRRANDSHSSRPSTSLAFAASRDTIVLSPEPVQGHKLRKKVSMRIISAGKEFVRGIERMVSPV